MVFIGIYDLYDICDIVTCVTKKTNIWRVKDKQCHCIILTSLEPYNGKPNVDR